MSRKSKEPIFRWIHDPDTVEELVQTENFLDLLCSSLIFFHNKKPSVDNLVFNTLKRYYQDTYRLERFNSHEFTFDDYHRLVRKNIRSAKKLIFLVDSTDTEKTVELVMKISASKSTNLRGIWVRGFIPDLVNLIPSAFHGLFIFDTSNREFDWLRTRLAISKSMISSLRRLPVNSLVSEKIIFYLNYDHFPDSPELSSNPRVLGVDASESDPTKIIIRKRGNRMSEKQNPTFSIQNNFGNIAAHVAGSQIYNPRRTEEEKALLATVTQTLASSSNGLTAEEKSQIAGAAEGLQTELAKPTPDAVAVSSKWQTIRDVRNIEMMNGNSYER